jgi:hypothetical protein
LVPEAGSLRPLIISGHVFSYVLSAVVIPDMLATHVALKLPDEAAFVFVGE